MADNTVTAGRGVMYIALAKFYFMMAGYVIYFRLPVVLGKDQPELWGNYLLVVGLVSVIDNVLVTATIQAVSKFTAQDESQAEGVMRAALKIQLFLGIGLPLCYVALAPLVARWERDASLTPLYQLSAGIMLCYAFYAVLVGSLNGRKQFGKQAALDVSFATLRALLILGFASKGWGVAGAVGGFVTAAAVILVVSALWVGIPRGRQTFPVGQIWRYTLDLFVYTLALNLIMRVDLFLLKRYAATLSGEVLPAVQAQVASAYAGYYGTAQSLAFIPYQAILAVAFVIFPLVSRSTFEKDRSTTQAYIRQTLRLSLIFVAGVAVVFMANPAAVIGVPYPLVYRIGGPALRILSLGMVFFSMFTIVNTILNGAGRTRATIISGVVTLGLAAGANAILVPRASSPESALWVAAAATSGAMGVGLLLATVQLWREFAAGFPLRSLVRVAAAGAVALAVGHFIPERSKLFTLAECGVVLGVYVATLALLREFKSEDLGKLQRIFRRQRG